MTGITLLGLGPGARDQITREAWNILSSAEEAWLRTRNHPAIMDLPSSVTLHFFDGNFEDGGALEAVVDAIAQKVVELGHRPQGVIYAVPGHPLVAEQTAVAVFRRAGTEGLQVRVVGGRSFLEAACSALGSVSSSRLTLCDALSLASAHVPPFPPDAPVLISQLQNRTLVAKVKAVLRTIYPDRHTVQLIHGVGTSKQKVEDLPLGAINESGQSGTLTCLHVPPLETGSSLEAMQEVVAHLRAPEGCPWDREQTHASLRRHLLEETYEAISAMDSGSAGAIREELGDLLLQIFLNSQIAAESDEFTLNEVAKGIYDKIVRRHPHVFGQLKLEGVDGVLANWEKLKEAERDGMESSGGLLEGVPLALPALSQAQEYQERATRVGFDWPEIQGVLEKIVEEIREVEGAIDAQALESEIGDLLFALVNLSRWKAVDAESALRAANQRFKKRLGFIEQTARQRKQRLSELTLQEMEALWEQAKALEN